MKALEPINEIYKDLLIKLYHAPIYAPRDKKVTELINHTVELNSYDNVITLEGFETKLKYAELEWEWYKSGSNRIDYAPLIKKIWSQFSDDGETVNSAYGYQMFRKLFDKFPYCQVDYVVEKLRLDKDSRQAVININVPEHKENFHTKDFPCTLSIQFLIRENELIMIVNMRSNDIFYGFRNDVYCFGELHKLILKDLQFYYKHLRIGQYYHNAASLHLYEPEWPKVRELLK